MGLFRIYFAIAARFGPWVLLAAFLFLAAILLTILGRIFGFTLDDVDAWLAGHSSWLTAVADILFRLGCLFVLVCCAVVVIGAVHGKFSRAGRDLVTPPKAPPAPIPGFRPEAGREAEKPPGLGCAFLALILGYFAFVGTFMRY